jgi:hypothetical protein
VHSVRSLYFLPLMQHTGANAPSPPWGIPVNITVPANADCQPITAWDSLRFSPIGAYHLRCWQGVFPGIKNFFITCQSRFRSADIAWFASGTNRDGNHNHPPSSFHPSLVRLVRDSSSAQAKGERKALLAELKEQMFDIVCFLTHLIWIRLIIYLLGNNV